MLKIVVVVSSIEADDAMIVQSSRRARLAFCAVVLIAAGGLFGVSTFEAQSEEIDSVVTALRRAARLPIPSAPAFRFPATVIPDKSLLLRLQTTFERFFPDKPNLIPVLRKLIVDSAVTEIPGGARILYNPRHSLFLYLETESGSSRGNGLRIATLDDAAAILKQPFQADQPLVGYLQGFDVFHKLSSAMLNSDGREAFQMLWLASPRSEHDKKTIQYQLLRPVQQAASIATEPDSCQKEIDRFVDQTRAGKRLKIRPLPGLSNNLRPSNFLKFGDKLLLILSEALIARYYVVAEFKVNPANCSLLWEEPLFVM